MGKNICMENVKILKKDVGEEDELLIKLYDFYVLHPLAFKEKTRKDRNVPHHFQKYNTSSFIM
jgi:hypothetical protein